MKKIFLILLVCWLISFMPGSAQENFWTQNPQDSSYWVKQTSGVTEALNAVFFADENHGCAVGEKGVIITTEDGGAHWVKQNSTTDLPLYGVYFKTAELGWTVGDQGVLLCTRDGGKTWISGRTDTKEPLYGVYFLTPEKGWVSGGKLGILAASASLFQLAANSHKNSSVLLATENGGANWRLVENPLKQDIQSVYFLNDKIGWAAGAQGDTIVTFDGGKTWEKRPTKVDKQLFDIVFTDEKTGWAVGGRYRYLNNGMFGRDLQMRWAILLKTTDGGLSWEKVNINQGDSPAKGIFNRIFMFENLGWLGGFRQAQTNLFFTSDRGTSWEEITIEPFIRDSFFVKPNLGWLVGDNGTILCFKPQLNESSNK